MVLRRAKVPAFSVAAFAALVSVAAACGGEARSEGDDESRSVEPAGSPAPAADFSPSDVASRHEVPPAPETRSAGADDLAEAAGDPEPEAPVVRRRPEPVQTQSEPVRTRPERQDPIPGTVRRTDTDPLPPEPVARPELSRPTVRAGTRVELVLETALSTRTTRSGQPFTARVQGDVLAPDGMVLIPDGSTVRGTVAESRESEGPDRPAVLRLVPESVVIDGRPRPLRATVVEADVQADTRDSNTETAGKVAAGAAAGAILGQILGRDTETTLKGAAAGAVAGTAVAMATRGGHAEMQPGALLVARIDQPLVVDR